MKEGRRYLPLCVVVAELCKAILIYTVPPQLRKEGRRYLALYVVVAELCKAILLYNKHFVFDCIYKTL
jgi:hypothetical protein